MALPPHTLPVGNPSQVMGLRRPLAVSRAKTHLSFIFFCVTFAFWYSMAWRSVNQCAWKVQNFLQNMNRFLRQWCWGCVSVAYVFSKSLSKLGGKNLMVSWGVKAFIYCNSFPLWLSQFVQMFGQEGRRHTVFSNWEMKKNFTFNIIFPDVIPTFNKWSKRQTKSPITSKAIGL